MTPAEEIKSRLDIVTLVSSYLKLEKSGVNFKARCPFHNERTASFYVSPARDIWHCFGCGKGGDVFKFVMEMDGLEFPEALRMLADRAGVTLGSYTRTSDAERSLRARLLSLLEEAALFFEKNLESAPDVLVYLEKRGLMRETARTFRLGYAPESWRALGEHLGRLGYRADEIAKAGLSVEGPKGSYDRFRARIIFPLEDSLGRVIGFGGRIFPPDADASGGKYINTPQTPLYDKSRFLYGLSKTKGEIRREGKIVVVEGYMDLILSYQAGVKNVVAVSGTALTESHLRLLKRLGDLLIFAFDVDAAGLAASRRAAALAHKEDFHVRFVTIEGGKDPADAAREDAGAWRAMVEGAAASVGFFLKYAVGAGEPSDPFAKKKIGEELLPLIAMLASEIERAHWVRELARILKISEEALWRELGKYAGGEAPSGPEDSQPPADGITHKARLEERIAGLVLIEPTLAALAELPHPEDCSLASTADFFGRLSKSQIHGTIEEFLNVLPEDVRREASRYALEAELFASGDGKEREFLSLVHAWKELSLKEKLEKLRGEIARLEAEGKAGESESPMREFSELAAHLAHVISLHHHGDQKEKK